MKQKIILIAKSIAIILILSILFSLIFTILYYVKFISFSTFTLLNWIFGGIAYTLGGILLGYGIMKKSLFHALGVVLVLALITLLMIPSFEMMNLIELFSKLLLYLVGSLIGKRLKEH